MASTQVIEHEDKDKSEDTLIIIVNSDGTLTVDPHTLEKVLANQSRATVSVIRIDSPDEPDSQTEKSNDNGDIENEDNQAGEKSRETDVPRVNLTVEGFYPPPPVDEEGRKVHEAIANNADSVVSSTVATPPSSVGDSNSVTSSLPSALSSLHSHLANSLILNTSSSHGSGSSAMTEGGVGDSLGDAFSEMDSEQIKRLETALHSEKAKQILGDEVTSMLDILSKAGTATNSAQQNVNFDHCYTSLVDEEAGFPNIDELRERISERMSLSQHADNENKYRSRYTSSDSVSDNEFFPALQKELSDIKRLAASRKNNAEEGTRSPANKRSQSNSETNFTEHDLERMLEDEQDVDLYSSLKDENKKIVTTKSGRQSTMLLNTSARKRTASKARNLAATSSKASSGISNVAQDNEQKVVGSSGSKKQLSTSGTAETPLFSSPDVMKFANNTDLIQQQVGSSSTRLIPSNTQLSKVKDLVKEIVANTKMLKDPRLNNDKPKITEAERNDLLYKQVLDSLVKSTTNVTFKQAEDEKSAPVIVKVCRTPRSRNLASRSKSIQRPARSQSTSQDSRRRSESLTRNETNEGLNGSHNPHSVSSRSIENSTTDDEEYEKEESVVGKENDDDPNKLWCVCNKPHNNRFMICCDSCDNWFHGYCVGISKAMGEKMEKNGTEWICPPCRKEKSGKGRETEPKSSTRNRKKTPQDPDFISSLNISTGSQSEIELCGPESNASMDVDTPAGTSFSKPDDISSTRGPSDSILESNDDNSFSTAADSVGTSNLTTPVKGKSVPSAHGVGAKDGAQPARGKVVCINCQEEVIGRKESIYCSDACIDKYIMESLALMCTDKEPLNANEKLIVCERNSRRLIAGPNAPSVGNVKSWIRQHQTFEIVRPKNLPTSKFYSQFKSTEGKNLSQKLNPSLKNKQQQQSLAAKQFKATEIRPTDKSKPVQRQQSLPNVTSKNQDLSQSKNKIRKSSESADSKISVKSDEKPQTSIKHYMVKKVIDDDPNKTETFELVSSDQLLQSDSVQNLDTDDKKKFVKVFKIQSQLQSSSNKSVRHQSASESPKQQFQGQTALQLKKRKLGEDEKQRKSDIPARKVELQTIKKSETTIGKKVETPLKKPPDVKKTEHSVSRKSIDEGSAENTTTDSDSVRQSVKKSLQELLTSRLKDTTELTLDPEEVSKLSTDIEVELHNLFKDTGMKYKSKYRSLLFNIRDKKNTLFLKIAQKSLSAYNLVRLTPEELASQELAQWRQREAKHEIDMIKKSELELLAQTKTHVVKTHKGEQEIETDDKIPTGADIIVPDLTSDIVAITNIDGSKVDSGKKLLSSFFKDKETTSSSKDDKTKGDKKHSGGTGGGEHSSSSRHHRHGKHDHHKDKHRKHSRRSSDRHKSHHSKSSRSNHSHHRHKSDDRKEDNKSEDREDENHQRNSAETSKSGSDNNPSLTPPHPPDLPFDENLVDPISNMPDDLELPDNEPSSTVMITTPPYMMSPPEKFGSCLWKGFVTMPEVTSFAAVIKEVSGNCAGIGSYLLKEIVCVGRINPSTVWEYISKVKRSGNKEILLFSVECGSDDETDYLGFYSYLNNKNRMAVVGVTSPKIKDFYLFPLPSHSPIPQVLLPIDGPGFGEFRTHLLLGIIIRSKRYSLKYSQQHSKNDYSASIATTAAAATAAQYSSKNLVPINDDDDYIPAPPGMEEESFTPPHSPTQDTIRDEILESDVMDPFEDDEQPYSPGEEMPYSPSAVPGENEPVVKTNDNDDIQKQMEELNRKIEEEKQLIESMSAGQVDLPSQEISQNDDGNEDSNADVDPSHIRLPSNIQEILDSIKKHDQLQSDPIISAYKNDTEAPYSPGENPIMDDIEASLEDLGTEPPPKKKSKMDIAIEKELNIEMEVDKIISESSSSQEVKISRDPRQQRLESRSSEPPPPPAIRSSEPPPPGVDEDYAATNPSLPLGDSMSYPTPEVAYSSMMPPPSYNSYPSLTATQPTAQYPGGLVPGGMIPQMYIYPQQMSGYHTMPVMPPPGTYPQTSTVSTIASSIPLPPPPPPSISEISLPNDAPQKTSIPSLLDMSAPSMLTSRDVPITSDASSDDEDRDGRRRRRVSGSRDFDRHYSSRNRSRDSHHRYRNDDRNNFRKNFHGKRSSNNNWNSGRGYNKNRNNNYNSGGGGNRHQNRGGSWRGAGPTVHDEWDKEIKNFEQQQKEKTDQIKKSESSKHNR